ncbi:MAG: glycosyltransferase family 9 protein [Acidobacteria bacterium]|nr:glycosyltransferase family 9 protein [Acidobacteriota bacterium]
MPESLLVIRLGAMGDIIHTMAAVAALRAALPDARIGWVIEERWVELLCAKGAERMGPRNPARPLVDAVHVVNTKLWRKLPLAAITRHQVSAAIGKIREPGYELAVDFQGALKSALLARLAGARKIVGMKRPREAPASMFYHQRVLTPGSHVIDQYSMLAEAVAQRSLALTPVVFPEDHGAQSAIAQKRRQWGRDFVLLSPGAGWGGKRWPAQRYAEVAQQLERLGLLPVVNAAPGEEELARTVEAASQAQSCFCSLGELIALTRCARLFIGGDSGPLHLAAALGVPVVAIFGPTDPKRNGPYGTKSIVLRSPRSHTSLSHTSAPDPGLVAISCEEVIDAAERLLGEIRV